MGVTSDPIMFPDWVLRIEIVDNAFEIQPLSDGHKQIVHMQESNFCKVLKVKTMNVSSDILAHKSCFFRKMFNKGMRDSKKPLKINAYEEDAFVDLLHYILYYNTLREKNPLAMWELLMIAVKFEVPSCIGWCFDTLCCIPLTHELALLILNRSPSIIQSKAFQPLLGSAMTLFCRSMEALHDSSEEISTLDRSVIEAILSRDDLQMNSEDVVYDFLMKWVTIHFSTVEERREFLHSQLCKLIRFPFMSSPKLKEFSRCIYVDNAFASKIVQEVALYKLEIFSEEHAQQKEELRRSKELLYVKRVSLHHPVRVVEFDLPCEQSIVFLDLKQEVCQNLEHGAIRSETFYVGNQTFHLAVQRKLDKYKSPTFGLRLNRDPGQRIVTVVYEFAVRKKPSNKFERKARETCLLTRRNSSVGSNDLFRKKWDDLMAQDSKFFINGNMHLRAEILIKL